MINNVNDISPFLEILKTKTLRKDGLTKKILYPFVRKFLPLSLHASDFDEVYEFGLNLNLYIEQGNRVKLTPKGSSVVDMKHSGIDLTPEQKKYIVDNCIFENIKLQNITRFLKSFSQNNWPISKTRMFEDEISILSQFGVIKKIGSFWVIESDYLDYVEQIKEGVPKPMTQKQLEAILAEQKRIGDLAEEFTVEYEKKRLRKKKLNSESKKVQKISTKYVNKGYDVESFSKKSKEANLFIEVKGRKWDLTSFIISINEIKTAKRLGEKYAIYFWNNVGSKNPPKEPLKIINDPFRKLSFDECKNCLNFLVEI